MWPHISGKKGGFADSAEEEMYHDRARMMLERIQANPGPIARKALKMKEDLPYYWLSQEDNLILCGKIDWIEYLEESDSVHIIDFKTGKREERSDSLQLPIYYLLAQNCQKRPVEKISYWYIDRDDEPKSISLPDEKDATDRIMKIGQRIKLARQLDHFKCSTDPKNGCIHCAPYEAILSGKGEFVGVGEYNKEVYILADDAVAL
jgi:ATP-dependent helicase/DNAse subunit B